MRVRVWAGLQGRPLRAAHLHGGRWEDLPQQLLLRLFPGLLFQRALPGEAFKEFSIVRGVLFQMGENGFSCQIVVHHVGFPFDTEAQQRPCNVLQCAGLPVLSINK